MTASFKLNVPPDNCSTEILLSSVTVEPAKVELVVETPPISRLPELPAATVIGLVNV